jgi:hypothetical protein
MVRMVTRESATLLSTCVHDQIAIDGDHSSIVKFMSCSDHRYKNFLQRLKQGIERTVDRGPGRFYF